MSDTAQRPDVTKMRVVYEVAGMNDVIVRRDVEYRHAGAGPLTMDLYYPPGWPHGAQAPAVLFVLGYPDRGAEAVLGCKLKEMESLISWARLIAASGMIAVLYTTHSEPAADARTVLGYMGQNATSLGIDERAVGLWAASGNVPNALSILMEPPPPLPVRCAALCYGLTLDLDGSAAVAEASRTFRFVNPCAGRSVDDLPRDVPLFLVRAGRDEVSGLNATLDRFVAAALARNLPVTLVNHAGAPHAFDLMDRGATSREVIRQLVAFLSFHLRPDGGPSNPRRAPVRERRRHAEQS